MTVTACYRPAFRLEPRHVREVLGPSADDLLTAAGHGSHHGDDLGVSTIEAICAAYVSMVQDDAARAEDLRLAEMRADALGRELAKERALNAQLRLQLAELTGDTVVVEVDRG